MADNWVESLADDLQRWADGRADADDGPIDDLADLRRVDVQGALLLLDLAREELRLTAPADLTPERLRELLLDVFPDEVVAGADEVPAILATAGTLLEFLGESGAVPAGQAAALRAELDRLAPEFAELVARTDTTERQAAAEVITAMMVADRVSLDDQDAVEEWVRAFEALPEDERYARTEEYLRQAEELVVPPVRLAPEAELAAAARASTLTSQVRALAEWAAGRPVTEFGDLGGDDAAAAVAALGLETPRRAPDAPVQDQSDLPELDRLWWAATEAEVLKTVGGVAEAGPSLPELLAGDDETVLGLWLRLFDAVAVPEHEGEDGLDAIELVQNELTGVLIHLYEQEAPSSAKVLADVLIEHVTAAYELSDGHAVATAARQALDWELADLAGWGALEVAGDGYALTPLGVWAVRELLVADGFVAPVVGDLAESTAADLVAGLAWHRQDTADEEIAGWLAGREAEPAAAELLEVMRNGGPGARNLAAAVLHRMDAEIAQQVRDAADHPLVGPYAAVWLNQKTGAPMELERREFAWMFVDTVAGMLETTEPAEAVAAALAGAPAEVELDAMIDEMWRCDHPDTPEVLAALGDHVPDRAVAKAARKAAYKARSGRGGA
ncbi:hypothetical protein SMC26_37005 [Actinomadura fulvescens]|uniref:Uncharacterized protein n=1 Tax=Actinomadura fulvescens TaxID=46160 RepID=A0ABN3PH36_9ACTN